MRMEKLKPCPFCGSTDIDTYVDDPGWCMYCKNRDCQAAVFFSRREDTPEDVIRKWNVRAPVSDGDKKDKEVR